MSLYVKGPAVKFGVLLSVATLLTTAPSALAKQSPVASSSAAQSAQLQIGQKTEVPGLSLSPGSYDIRVQDQLKDRVIVQVQKKGSKSSVSLLAFPNPELRGGSFTGPVSFVTGLKGEPTLRGYAFSGGPTLEFIYPKADAVTLAKANSVRVMAVDPASEGRVSLPHLTQDDMTEVTLWMLTPTPVDPATAKPGISAAKYQAPVTQAQDTAPVTSSAPAPSTYSAQSQPSNPPQPLYHAPAAKPPVQVASNNHPPRLRPNVKQLPHTASNLPLIALVGWMSLVLAGALSFRRLLGTVAD